MTDKNLDSIVKNALKNPQKWDEVRHAPLCDDRTNELICIYLELVRMACRIQPMAIHTETLEPFPVYAIDRLNSLFHTDIQISWKKMEPAEEGTTGPQ